MTRARLSVLVVPALLVVPLVGMTPATSAAESRTCLLAGTGLVENLWQGGNGSWSDAGKWSLGVPPGPDSRQYACLPPGVEVTLDSGRVDVQALEVGKESTLTLAEGTALYVRGDADQESLFRAMSTVVVQGATLGGSGRIHVIGTVEVSNGPSTQGRLSGDGSTTGVMLVGDDGTLDFAGDSGDVRLSDGYTVDVRGRARMLMSAGLVADVGTTLELGKHLDGSGRPGRLVIRNERGFFSGGDPASVGTLVNDGRIVKRKSGGRSAISAHYAGDGEVRIRSGYLVLPDEADDEVEVSGGASVGSGTCADTNTCVTDTTPTDRQFASLALPELGSATDVVVAPLDEKAPGAIGKPMQVHADDLDVTAADPAVIELRYDRTLLEAEGEPANPDALSVKHSHSGTTYTPIPDCLALGAIPTDAFACVDRRSGASRRDEGDVILVVRTTRTSRWIAY